MASKDKVKDKLPDYSASSHVAFETPAEIMPIDNFKFDNETKIGMIASVIKDKMDARHYVIAMKEIKSIIES